MIVAKINTKSNFQNLNGKWLEVKEMVETRVTCSIQFAEFGKKTVDFHLKEIVAFDTTGKTKPETFAESIFNNFLNK